MQIIDDEYRILRDFSEHPNIVDFYGVYRKRIKDGIDEIWFVLQVSLSHSHTQLIGKNIVAKWLEFFYSFSVLRWWFGY